MTRSLKEAFSTIPVSKATRLFQSFFALDKYVITHPCLEAPVVREVFVRGHAACVLLYDPKLEKVMVVEEFRIGNHAAGYVGADSISMSPVAGMVEPGQSPLDTALREAVEEAGVVIDEMEIFGPISTLPSPGGSSEVIHHYVAFGDLSNVVDGARYGLAREGEVTQVRLVNVDDLNPWKLTAIPQNGLLVTTMGFLRDLMGKEVV